MKVVSEVKSGKYSEILSYITEKNVLDVLMGRKDPPNAVLKHKRMVIQPPKYKITLPKRTASLCPECGKIIPAEIYEKDGKVMIRKKCPDHGEFEDIYLSDVEIYLKFGMFAIDGVGIENPHTKFESSCPYDCGLCEFHLSHSNIVNIDLTNRCNMNCPICFANANAAGFVYEPSFDEVVNMLKLLRAERPVPAPAVQFAGGEPTIYPRFLDAVRIAKQLGFPQVQVATNGILLAQDPTFAQKLRDAGLDTVYLQFDGFKEETYIKTRARPGFLKEKLQAIENCRNTKPKPLAVVLVPVIVRGVNDDEVGKMVDFAIENIDVVRSVNFQPVSFSGRINYEERIKGRYTIADLINDLVNQTDYLKKEDFFPIPVAAAFAEAISGLHKDPKVAFTTHAMCGTASYIFIGKDGKVASVSDFVDVWGLYRDALEIAETLEGTMFQRLRIAARSLKILKYIDMSRAPKGMNLRSLIRSVIFKADKESLGKIHWRSLFIGAMHFMDRYNYDIERVRRCVVHYATPDGRLIPFCAYNTGPTFRTEVESKFAMSFAEYHRRYGTNP